MNPIVQMVDKYKAYRLDKKDLAKLRRVKLGIGESQWDSIISDHEMCVMQLVAMVTTQHEIDPTLAEQEYAAWRRGWVSAMWTRRKKRWQAPPTPPTGYTDHPICVSEELTGFLIELNDNCSNNQRAQLKKLVPEILNTCPITVKQYKTKPAIEVRDATNPEYRAAEAERRLILEEAEHSRGEDEWGDPKPVPFKTRIEAVKRAAALYRTAPGLADELLQGEHQ